MWIFRGVLGVEEIIRLYNTIFLRYNTIICFNLKKKTTKNTGVKRRIFVSCCWPGSPLGPGGPGKPSSPSMPLRKPNNSVHEVEAGQVVEYKKKINEKPRWRNSFDLLTRTYLPWILALPGDPASHLFPVEIAHDLHFTRSNSDMLCRFWYNWFWFYILIIFSVIELSGTHTHPKPRRSGQAFLSLHAKVTWDNCKEIH